MNSRVHRTALIAFAAPVLVAAMMAGTWVPAAKADVVPFDGYGASYGEWSARWWQWILSIPAETNPNLEGDCAQGQFDRVWFLASRFSSAAVTRECTIPADMPILVPVVNVIAYGSTAKETLLDRRAAAKRVLETFDPASLRVTIDGQAVEFHRATSPAFKVINAANIRPRGWFTGPGNGDSLVSDGYWVLLEPLPAGMHHIRIQGETYDRGYWVDVNYNLTVN